MIGQTIRLVSQLNRELAKRLIDLRAAAMGLADSYMETAA